MYRKKKKIGKVIMMKVATSRKSNAHDRK